MTISTPLKVLDALLASIQKAADYNANDTVAPAAILWTDEKKEWERLVPRLRVLVPHFLVFGPYDKANRTGPAIWLRCVLDGKVPEITWAPGTVPVIYLPGVSRATLRATEDCPNELGVTSLSLMDNRLVHWRLRQSVCGQWGLLRLDIQKQLQCHQHAAASNPKHAEALDEHDTSRRCSQE